MACRLKAEAASLKHDRRVSRKRTVQQNPTRYPISNDTQGELSEAIPFLEFELYNEISTKLKVMGMNSIFGLQLDISIGPNLLVGTIRGTAIFLPSLPAPPLVSVSPGSSKGSLRALSRNVEELSISNRTLFQDADVTHLQPVRGVQPLHGTAAT